MIRNVLFAMVGVSLCASLGCVNQMSGKVDGNSVGPVRVALFDEIDTGMTEYGADGLMFSVVITSADPNTACDMYKDYHDIDYMQGCEDYCADVIELGEQYLTRPEYWTASLSLLPDGDAEGTYEEGDVWDLVSGDAVFSGSLVLEITEELLDEDLCIEMCEDPGGEPDNYWEADGGTVDVTGWSESEQLAGEFSIDFDGDPIDGKFQAEYCDYMPEMDYM